MPSKPPYQDQIIKFSIHGDPSPEVQRASFLKQQGRIRARLRREADGEIFVDGRSKKKKVTVTENEVMQSEDIPTGEPITAHEPQMTIEGASVQERHPTDYSSPYQTPSHEPEVVIEEPPATESVPPTDHPTGFPPPHELEMFLELLFGTTPFVHYFSKRPEYEEALERIQKKTASPLDANNPEFQDLTTTWIYEPGIHIGVDTDEKAIIFAVRITPFENMVDRECERLQLCLKALMDWTFAVPSIKSNGAHTKHSDDKNKRNGNMYGLGWHGSMEPKTSIVWYAPANSKNSLAEYSRMTPEIAAEIALIYRTGLASLYPAAFHRLVDFAHENQILGFHQFGPQDIDLSVFSDSLIITRDDFSNYQHRDRDAVEVAYGLWWAGLYDDSSKRFILSDHCDHDMISGGSFLFGSYGYGIQFEKCKGLVEVTWRGSLDLHSTMMSQSSPGATRFGTSVQITRRSLQSIQTWRAGGSKPSRVTTHQDRIDAKCK